MATCIQTATFFNGGEKCRPGGCALHGAKLALQPITDAVHIVHGTASCLGHAWSSRPTASSDSLLHRNSITTALGEVQFVLGDSKQLHHLLNRVNSLSPTAIFIYQSCLTAMTGEDLQAECKIASRQLGIPVLAVQSSGLAGGKQTGNRLAAQLLCEQVIGTSEPPFRTSADINLIGEFNVHGEVAELRKILSSFGIRILSSIPGDARYQEIAYAHRAHVSLDLCSQSMPRLAEYLQDKFGIPIVRGSLYGGSSFAETLRQLVRTLLENGARKEIDRKLNAWLEDEQRRYYKALTYYRPRLKDKRVVIDVGGVKSWALINELQAAGLVIRGVSLRKCSERDAALHDAIRNKCRQAGLNEWQHEELDRLLVTGDADIVISSDRLKYSAHKNGIPFVEISHERSFSLLGYRGVLRLLDEIDLLMNSPVHGMVRANKPVLHEQVVTHKARIVPAPPGSINPFALTQPIGAALALQGVQGCAPLLFGAQGCADSGTTLLSRYFDEPIHLATVSMNDSDTIYGGHKALRTAIDALEPHKTELLAVISTGMMSAQGASDISIPRSFKDKAIFLHAPDFQGTLETGWGKASHALVRHALARSSPRQHNKSRKLLILPGAHLTISDLEWLKDVTEAFGMAPLAVPDISTTLDGRAGERTAAIEGGVRVSQFEQIAECCSYLAFGNEMSNTAEELSRAGIQGLLLSAWTGLRRTDELLHFLAAISGVSTPKKYCIQRKQLLDAMMDHLPPLSHMCAAVAAEPDLLTDLCDWLQELGVRKLTAVSPSFAHSLRALPLDEVHVGDYQVLASHLGTTNILLAPDSARGIAKEAGIAHYPIGIHEPHRCGEQFRLRMGYQGARDQLYALVNRQRD